MTAKKYLENYRWAEERIRRIQRDIDNLTADNISLGSVNSAGPVQSSSSGDMPMVNTVDNIDKKRKRLKKKQDELFDIMCDVSDSIYDVQDDRENRLLEHVYINGLTLEQAAEKMNYSERHISRLHKSALSHIIIPDKYI